MLHLFRYAVLFVTLVGALALPIASEPLFDDLEARGMYHALDEDLFTHARPTAANLQISLRESKPRTPDWHFALVIHPPGGADGGRLTAHEFVIWEK